MILIGKDAEGEDVRVFSDACKGHKDRTELTVNGVNPEMKDLRLFLWLIRIKVV